MAYKYKHFIPENIAPAGAKRIGIYNDNGERIDSIPLGRLAPVIKNKLYSFCIISDLHVSHNLNAAWQPVPKFDKALTLFESKGCSFCIACGDLTNTGFYRRTVEDDASTTYLSEELFAKYKEVCDKHTIPLYELCGNHESYYGMPITNNLALLETYTGKGVLSYTVAQGNDLFILCGQPKDSAVISDDDFQWLSETLETNKDKRCFVFIHSHIDDNVEGGVEDSGNPCYARENSIFGYWGATNRTNFINLMKQYPNTILFHGHTHIKFEAQQFDPQANYTEENGFKSVHVPSSGSPREVISEDGTWVARDSESQGYIVDVYDDCVVLNGMDLINNVPVPLGVYKIDTIKVEPPLLPYEYQPVSYIQTDGTQYIDTGVNASDYPDGITYTMQCNITGKSASGKVDYYWGVSSGGSRSGYVGMSTNGKTLTMFAGGSGDIMQLYDDTTFSKDVILQATICSNDIANAIVSFDGNPFDKVTASIVNTAMPNANIWLFACNGISDASGNRRFYGKCSRFTMTAADGTIIRDYVPCYRKADGVIGLYDTVTKAFSVNEGLGSFTKGADVVA